VIDTGFGLDADEELMFDTAAPRRHGATLSVLGAADVVIAAGAADPIGLQRLITGLPELREVTGPATPVQVVITKVRDQAIGGAAADRVRAALARYAGVDDPVLIPDDRRALDAAMLAGRMLVEVAPSSSARRAIGALADRLLAPGQPLDDGSGTGPVTGPVTASGRNRRLGRGWLARAR
jgi:Flp pilus assembly CpaE family ATPase